MKKRTKIGLSKPLKVYAAEISKLDGNTRAKMSVEDHVKRTLRNQRSALNPVEPTSLDNLVIDDEWCTTGHPEYQHFLIFNNGFNFEERILIFGTVESMKNLSTSNTCIFITAIYCLLQRKTSETYEIKAVVLAIEKLLPKVKIHCCYFHLTPPLFPPSIWNVFELTKAGIGRTGNISEGWNNKFTTLVRINHPNIWLFIEALQMSNSSASIKILNYRTGAFRNNLVSKTVISNSNSKSVEFEDNSSQIESTSTQVTVATAERSFSKLKIIKNYLRNACGQNRLTNIAILNIEQKQTSELKIDKLIKDLSNIKARKMKFV
ncbi:hypothetical protein QTP88_014260 [Uroleucon formosanum]